MSTITVLWHEKDSENCTDVLPIEWFSKPGVLKGRVHDVRGPRSGGYQAKCDVTVQANLADLDYSPYDRFNEGRGMFLGVMRICFDADSRLSVTQVLWRDDGKKEFSPAAVTVGVQQEPDVPELEFVNWERLSGLEGRKRLVLHFKRERSAKLISAKKAAVLASSGKLACEACGFTFSEKYGDLGEGFCEIHHRVALSSTDSVVTELSDLAIVCSNCHRMIHRTGDPMLSVEEFARKWPNKAPEPTPGAVTPRATEGVSK